jgi:hypothetical protein
MIMQANTWHCITHDQYRLNKKVLLEVHQQKHIWQQKAQSESVHLPSTTNR